MLPKNRAPLSHYSHSSPGAFILLVITLLFVGFVFKTHPDFEKEYLSMFGITLNRVPVDVVTAHDPYSVSISEFGTSSENLIINEETSAGSPPSPNTWIASTTDMTASSTASSTPELTPTQLEGFKPSPESEWVTMYFNILDTNFDILNLNIEYVRTWQQTGGFGRDLKLGAKGTDVKLLQYLLSIFEPSFNKNSITGIFGPQTKKSLATLQKRLQLNPDGNFQGEVRFFFDSVYFKELCPDSNPDQDKSFENVGRRIAVPLDYIPSDLIRLPRTVRTIGIMCLSKEPSRRLDEMFQVAKNQGFELAVFSAYRSPTTQTKLTNYFKQSTDEKSLRSIAEAGHSEHQLGTTVDITGRSVGYAGTTQSFGNTPEGKWLEQNSYKFGFILSYPQGKDTGYIYEPWHFRYVGVDTARDIYEEKMTIQEYLNLVKGGTYTLEESQEIVR